MGDRVVVIHENDRAVVAAPSPTAVVVTDRPTPPAVIVRDTASTIVVPGPTERVVTVTERPTVVAIASPAQGPPGPAGPSGDGSGTAPSSYTVTGVSSWSQTHTFAWLPEVRLVDAAGFEVDVGVEYPDAHTVYLEFPTPFTGTIYLS